MTCSPNIPFALHRTVLLCMTLHGIAWSQSHPCERDAHCVCVRLIKALSLRVIACAAAGVSEEERAPRRSLWPCRHGVFSRSHSEGHGGAWRAADSAPRRGVQRPRVSCLLLLPPPFLSSFFLACLRSSPYLLSVFACVCPSLIALFVCSLTPSVNQSFCCSSVLHSVVTE